MTDISMQSSPSEEDFSLVKTGNITLDATVATQGDIITSQLAHNLNFIPIPMGFINSSGAYIPLPTFLGIADAGTSVGMNVWMWLVVDSTYVYLNLYPATTANWGTFNCKLFLFRDRASK